ncbi:complement C1q tumor necrosis factor-related protein 6-like [Mya arenaria]|uniref:complement C1q tumor necrosis factor-related protein 6-like n=1 Tax=Mya arenaria TaxID=6604 RepID=UPI0022E4FB1D|nr:complement C1q tumor necrosis factor-related protein 6-like [Mya arenaria]
MDMYKSEVEGLKAENKWGKEQLQQLTDAMFTTEGELRTRRQGNEETEIAFFATIRTAQPHLGQGQTVIFDNVVTNIDSSNSIGGYNKNTGTFTAPVNGLYVFSATLLTVYDQTSHASFFKNNQRLTVMYFHGYTMHDLDKTSQTIVLALKHADTISIRQTENDKSYFPDDHCLFSGFLLRQHYSGVIVG